MTVKALLNCILERQSVLLLLLCARRWAGGRYSVIWGAVLVVNLVNQPLCSFATLQVDHVCKSPFFVRLHCIANHVNLAN